MRGGVSIVAPLARPCKILELLPASATVIVGVVGAPAAYMAENEVKEKAPELPLHEPTASVVLSHVNSATGRCTLQPQQNVEP